MENCVTLNTKLPASVTLNERELADLEMLTSGAFHPLDGYLGQADYESVIRNLRLADGSLWPMPITLPVSKAACQVFPTAHDDRAGQTLQLRDSLGTILAEVTVTDIFEPNLHTEIEHVLGTVHENHPYAKYLLKNHVDCFYVGGPVKVIQSVPHFDFNELRLTPAKVREQLKGKTKILGFQTRNPMHRSHFEVTMQAVKQVAETAGDSELESVHLLLTPAVGPTQPGDVDSRIRIRCYKRLLEHYPPGSVSLVLIPLAMRMAGPREALWHALIRKNYGCSHFILGRDHAGPSVKKPDGTPFYGLYEAHELLKKYETEIGITPVFAYNMFYVKAEDRYVSETELKPSMICENVSGSKLRSLLENREQVPEWLSFQGVIQELSRWYRPRNKTGFCVYFTGLPCSGKSTLATALESKIYEVEEERKITVLDADIIRTHLSKGLGFSKDDRALNVRRIGYVASEIVKHGGICLVANIAPYDTDRKYNRSLVDQTGGGYIEVYVSTPLDVCENRDVKQLYKKARDGIVKQFTGISDPYEKPESAEITIDSSDDILGKTQEIFFFLQQHNWL